jgi:uncharacterized protein YbaP (TraB family)
MVSTRPVYQFLFVFALTCGCAPVETDAASACVWKVAGPSGGTLFLGGSIHFLQSTDYPLPSAYNRAFDASSRLVLEDDPKVSAAAFKDLVKAGQYPKGDSLKNHVDPRTYDYVRRFFRLVDVSEQTFSTFRPWLINLMLESPPPQYFALGVESFFTERARANAKPISGLESAKEHNQVFTGLSDREGEALLLILFINAGRTTPGTDLMAAWRRGDAETLARRMHESFRDFPSFGDRLLGARNRNWIPKLERYLRSGQICFVLVGAAHMGGADGLLALLRGRGCKIEQL